MTPISNRKVRVNKCIFPEQANRGKMEEVVEELISVGKVIVVLFSQVMFIIFHAA